MSIGNARLRPSPRRLKFRCRSANSTTVATTALDEVIALRGRAELEAVMAAEDDLAAAQIAAGLREMGVSAAFSADSLGVAEPMRTVFGRLMDKLANRGLLISRDGNYIPTADFTAAADSAPDKLRAFVIGHPGHLPEGLLEHRDLLRIRRDHPRRKGSRANPLRRLRTTTCSTISTATACSPATG